MYNRTVTEGERSPHFQLVHIPQDLLVYTNAAAITFFHPLPLHLSSSIAWHFPVFSPINLPTLFGESSQGTEHQSIMSAHFLRLHFLVDVSINTTVFSLQLF